MFPFDCITPGVNTRKLRSQLKKIFGPRRFACAVEVDLEFYVEFRSQRKDRKRGKKVTKRKTGGRKRNIKLRNDG